MLSTPGVTVLLVSVNKERASAKGSFLAIKPLQEPDRGLYLQWFHLMPEVLADISVRPRDSDGAGGNNVEIDIHMPGSKGLSCLLTK